MGRLEQWTVKYHAHRFQPAKRIGHVVDQDPTKPQIVWEARSFAEQPEILEVIIGIVQNALPQLVARVGRTDRPDRPCRRPAKLRVFFE